MPADLSSIHEDIDAGLRSIIYFEEDTLVVLCCDEI